MEKLFPKYIDQDISNIIDLNLRCGKLISNFAFNLINYNNGFIKSYGAKENTNQVLSWVEYDAIEVTHSALKLVIQLFFSVLQNNNLTEGSIDNLLSNYARSVQQYKNYSIELINASKELNIPSFQYTNSSRYRQYGWGKNSRIFNYSSPMEDSYHGVLISMDKAASKVLLKNLGMPVVKDAVIQSKEQLVQAVEKVGYPCVVKPIIGAAGTGISANITNFQQLETAFDLAKESTFGNSSIMIEKFIEGDDYRLMVLNGKFIGALKRTPTYVTGDGVSTIKILIETINVNRRDTLRNPYKLKEIYIDNALINHLKKYNLTIDSILEQNIRVPLSSVANYSAGGVIENVSDTVHAQIKQMAEAIAKVTEIYNLGIDYITTDITQSYDKTNGAITEYNHFTSLFSFELHKEPLKIFSKFLNGCGRIPVYLIVINNAFVNQLHFWIKENIKENSTGWCCNDEVYLGKLPLTVYNRSGWENVKILLRQKTLEKALIISTPEEVIKNGLPLDQFDIIYYDSVPPDWEDVLKNATSRLKHLSDLDQVFDLLEKSVR